MKNFLYLLFIGLFGIAGLTSIAFLLMYAAQSIQQAQADSADVFPFYRFVDAAAPEDFADYMSACQARALYDTGIFADYGDKLLTLSTCDNITDDGRLLVIANKPKQNRGNKNP